VEGCFLVLRLVVVVLDWCWSLMRLWGLLAALQVVEEGGRHSVFWWLLLERSL